MVFLIKKFVPSLDSNEEKKNETATKNASLGTVYSGSSNYGGRTSYSGNYDGDNDDNDDDDEDEEY